MTTKDKLIEKMEELIKWHEFIISSIIQRYGLKTEQPKAEIIKSEISALKSEVEKESEMSGMDLINRMRANKGDWTRLGTRLYYAEDAIIQAMTEFAELKNK